MLKCSRVMSEVDNVKNKSKTLTLDQILNVSPISDHERSYQINQEQLYVTNESCPHEKSFPNSIKNNNQI